MSTEYINEYYSILCSKIVPGYYSQLRTIWKLCAMRYLQR